MNEFYQLWKQCSSHLLGHRSNVSMKQIFQELTDSISPEESFDNYGTGKLIENFENEIASLLGKEKAVFMPSGIMAQQIALRIWCDRQNSFKVAFHPTCHLEFAEHLGYQYLHNIKRLHFETPEFLSERMLTVADFKNLAELPSAIILELPYSMLGGELPSWESLIEIREWATTNNVIMHLDGARLWESKHFYQKEYKEICSIFDSVYVSFYKGLGGITGAVLAGPVSLIKQAKVWQRRYGGNLFSLSPYVLSARLALAKNLGQIDKFVLRTQEIAKILSEYKQIRIHPNPPQTNMFMLYIEENAENLNKKLMSLMMKYKATLFPQFENSNIPGLVKTPMVFFENAIQFNDELLIKMLDELLKS